MNTAAGLDDGAAAIVRLAAAHDGDGASALERARVFAEPLLAGRVLDTGEDALAHAHGTVAVLCAIGAAPALQAAAYLVYAGDWLSEPGAVVAKAFGPSYAGLVTATRELVRIQRDARVGSGSGDAAQTERVRKMLLAFSRDLRVVLLRLASRLQTLRWHAASKLPCPRALALESRQVFAPLASRLGIWQIKWEIEDLAFRFLEPDDYKHVAALLAEKRSGREAGVEAARLQLAALLAESGIAADVQGRPKHLYSIWKKMRAKGLGLERVFDVRALRVIAGDVGAAYAALARVHERWPAVDGEYDDYIARPKPNGYQSLHTVVLGDDARPIEVQIRTRAMHEHAEHGVAAHWMYKEAIGPGRSGADAPQRIADARRAVLRELLAWERDVEQRERGSSAAGAGFDDRVYVFTPDAAIVELAAGGTPVDFAYSVHTTLGHRCRGARVDGRVVPLNTPLKSGQTVEIIAAKDGGPSLDWLNPEAHVLQSPRARAKVRAWFNAQALAGTVARGREAVEKLLQREGRTALKLETLAEQLGFKTADALFEVVGKDEYSLRNIEQLLKPAAPPVAVGDGIMLRRPRSDGDSGGAGGVLVVGIDSMLTTLARCCRPAPPDRITGYVTRGRGVAVHRADCAELRRAAAREPGRVIAVEWGAGGDGVYALDVAIEAGDRQGLLRDISDVFTKDRVNVTGVNSSSARDGTAWMTFTVEAGDADRLAKTLAQLQRVPGVRRAWRK